MGRLRGNGRSDEMMKMTVRAESTPGPIAINCSTFAGYKRAGIPGAFAATLGIVMPSFIVIYFISMYLDNFLELSIIANAFKGIKIGVGFLILNAGITMLKKMPKKKLSKVIMICSCITMLCIDFFAWKISSISLMVVAAMVSLVLFNIQEIQKQKGCVKE